MKKSIIFGLILLLFPCLMAADAPQVRVHRKIVTDTDRFKVIEVQSVGPNAHYEVNREALSERLNEEFAEKVSERTAAKVTDEIIKILEEILAQLAQDGGQPVPNPEPEPQPEPEPEDPFDNLPTDLDKQVKEIFFSKKYKCYVCHNEVKKNDDIQLTQGQNVAEINSVTKYRVHRHTLNGHMPPTPEKLTDEEVEILGKWADRDFSDK